MSEMVLSVDELARNATVFDGRSVRVRGVSDGFEMRSWPAEADGAVLWLGASRDPKLEFPKDVCVEVVGVFHAEPLGIFDAYFGWVDSIDVRVVDGSR